MRNRMSFLCMVISTAPLAGINLIIELEQDKEVIDTEVARLREEANNKRSG